MSKKEKQPYHIVTFTFPEEAISYQAFSKLKKYHADGLIGFEQLVVIKREDNGAFSFEDAVQLKPVTKSTKGALIGMAVGILGGPFGILFGTLTGGLIGGTKDLKHVQSIQETFKRTVGNIEPGQTGVMGIGEEFDDSVLDGLASELGGTITRTDEEL
ncbi:hypothetical protein EVJ27_11510 [Exiguobacterium sp. SH3S2]|uniref:hypothetical protein n=1 Tax=unclassified Exiguobacterium TaxID=2644629 RepID=UPI00103F02A8|nr:MULTISPECIES: hypothetical protein [unclassified Exiguobacterium]TCI42868.1 hypothetical protein EVJ28_11530 [Exiguobacterium sp. SH3S3]TCI58621.1 hypothetical protein EVJ27_11510 [Exiguobacterium sp. SH3S2]